MARPNWRVRAHGTQQVTGPAPAGAYLGPAKYARGKRALDKRPGECFNDCGGTVRVYHGDGCQTCTMKCHSLYHATLGRLAKRAKVQPVTVSTIVDTMRG